MDLESLLRPGLTAVWSFLQWVLVLREEQLPWPDRLPWPLSSEHSMQ